MPEETSSPARHETSDVPLRIVWIGVPGLIVIVVLMTLLILWMFPNGTVDRTLHLPLPHYPTPELQVSPRDDMARFSAQELQQLNGTGWVDEARGTVHIPIDDAMRKIAADGIEGWPTPSTQEESK
jgi:hypothetical protein